MTRTIIWRQRRRYELRKKLRCAAVCLILAILGAGPVLFKASEILADNADTKLSAEIIGYCEQVGEEYAICPELLEAVIEAESNGNPYEISAHGAVGLMQIKPEFSEYTTEELLDARTNIQAGAELILEYAEEYDDLYLVLTAYRYGRYSGEFESAERSGVGCKYAKKIVKRSEELERLHGK